MQTGTIKRLNDRGFGFIAVEGSSQDVFFHAKELQGFVFEDLREGDTLEFEAVDTDKGPQARNVRKVESQGATQ
jgi:CspA family cold shock protein